VHDHIQYNTVRYATIQSTTCSGSHRLESAEAVPKDADHAWYGKPLQPLLGQHTYITADDIGACSTHKACSNTTRKPCTVCRPLNQLERWAPHLHLNSVRILVVAAIGVTRAGLDKRCVRVVSCHLAGHCHLHCAHITEHQHWPSAAELACSDHLAGCSTTRLQQVQQYGE
jgi:hypothetical protein